MRKPMISILAAIALSAGVAGLAHAQTNIDPNRAFAWGENIGWLNWLDADGGVQGVRYRGTHLEGYIWGENVGWINVGNGGLSPGGSYANADGSTFGVNIDPSTGVMDGFAWGENIGWINFGTAPTLAAFNQEARFDKITRRFNGYAWGENVGWINMDDGTHYVAICIADINTTGQTNGIPDGEVNLSDLQYFLTQWQNDSGITPGSVADITTTGASVASPGYLVPDTEVNLSDLQTFLTLWANQCP